MEVAVAVPKQDVELNLLRVSVEAGISQATPMDNRFVKITRGIMETRFVEMIQVRQSMNIFVKTASGQEPGQLAGLPKQAVAIKQGVELNLLRVSVEAETL